MTMLVHESSWLPLAAVVGGAALPIPLRQRMVADEVSLSVLLLIAMLYMSVWICLNAHRDITTRRSRGE